MQSYLPNYLKNYLKRTVFVFFLMQSYYYVVKAKYTNRSYNSKN